MVSVKKTDINNKITVKTNKETNVFSIKDNLSEYYAKLAERWANSLDMVNGIDYSSKYYAEQSKDSAQVASNVKTETQELVDGFDNKVQIAKDDIEQNRINSINAIENTYSVAVGNMQEKSDEVLASIEASKDEAIDSINSTKTTILNDIEFIADGEKKEIEYLADEIKDSGNTVNTAIEAGIERLNSIDTLNKSQITNCITEVPQRIKYTLENGTLTIKAGSVVIVPYGNLDRTFYKVGNVTFNETTLQASNFSATNYLQTHERFTLGNSWEIVTKFTTGNDITTNQNILWCGDGMALNVASSKLGLYLGSGDGWNLAKAQAGKTTLTVNTTYYAKVAYNGSSYTMSLSTNGTSWNTEYTLINTTTVKSDALFQFGFYSGAIYFRGSIDISKTSITINGKQRFNPAERLTTKYPVGSTFLHENFKVYDTQYIPPQTPIVNYTDGRFFVWAELQSDIVTSANTAMGNGVYTIGIMPQFNSITARLADSQQGSGDGSNLNQHDLYYNTTTNIINTYYQNESDNKNSSFPIFLINKADSGFTYIDQVFNGYGYVGSAVWLDKGVKFLISNGRNDDETLKNIEYTTENFYIAHNTGTGTNKHYLTFTLDHIVGGKYYPIVWDVSYYKQVDKPSKTSCLWRNPVTNYMYALRTGFEGGILQSKAVVFGELTFTNGKVTFFNPKQPFRAVDHNDLQQLINREIGKPQISLDSNLPSGCVWLEGSTVSRTTYANLFAIYSTTYGEGDGSTTFKLPDFRNRAIWGSNGFGYLSAGLPNHKHFVLSNTEVTVPDDGSKRVTATTQGSNKTGTGGFSCAVIGGTSGSANVGLSSDPTSQTIYGKSTTVQPPAIKVRVYTRYK